MLGRGVAEVRSDTGWYTALDLLAPCISTVDIAFANLESPLTHAPFSGSSYDLRAPPEAAIALQTAGIDVVSLANNHAYDAGNHGLKQTRQALLERGVQSLGLDARAWSTTIRGLRLAWFAFDDTLRPLRIQNIRASISSVRLEADLIFVSIHWGRELEPGPNPRQRELAQAFADAGADIIIGHHPHVLQPAEWIWGKGRGRPTFVAFSLGNALFDQVAPPSVRHGAMLIVDVRRFGIANVYAVPFQVEPIGLRLVPAEGSAKQVIARSLGLSPRVVEMCPIPADECVAHQDKVTECKRTDPSGIHPWYET